MKSENRRRRWLIVCVIFGCWTTFGLFFASQHYLSHVYSEKNISWFEVLAIWLPCAYSWASLTPAILWLVERFPIDKKSWKRVLLTHLFASVFFSLLSMVIYLFTRQLLFWNKSILSVKSYKNIFLGGLHVDLLIYGVLVGVCYAIAYYHRYRERELTALQLQTQLVQAQLAALKAQLHPHFLFNTLNTISVLMDEDTKTARSMLARLSDLLRIVLKKETTDQVTLRQELEFLESYLEIERMRFHDKLRVKMHIDQNTLDARVPNFILQPLVENAIRYGVAANTNAGQVEIHAEKQNGNLRLEVRDDGPGIKEGFSESGNGVGLANTKARLEQIYGADHNFEMHNAESCGLVVSLTIPFNKLT